MVCDCVFDFFSIAILPLLSLNLFWLQSVLLRRKWPHNKTKTTHFLSSRFCFSPTATSGSPGGVCLTQRVRWEPINLWQLRYALRFICDRYTYISWDAVVVGFCSMVPSGHCIRMSQRDPLLQLQGDLPGTRQRFVFFTNKHVKSHRICHYTRPPWLLNEFIHQVPI